MARRPEPDRLQERFPVSNDNVTIDFTFLFDGVEYSDVSVNSNGVLSFDGDIEDPELFSLNGAGQPIIAPFWDYQRVPAGFNPCGLVGKIQYLVDGVAPNRTLVIDYENVSLADGFDQWVYAPVTFQCSSV